MTASLDECPDAIGGHGLADREGRCPYCQAKYEAKAPRPTRWAPVRAAILDAYDRFYNPDWGTRPADNDPY